MSVPRKVLPAAAVLAVAWLPPALLSDYWVFVGAQTAVQAVAVLSVIVLFRAAASVSLTQAGLMGIGAYAMSWTGTEHGAGYLVASVFGIAAAAVVGFVLALPALRLRGVELTVLTLAMGLAITSLVLAPAAPLAVTEYGAVRNDSGVLGLRFDDAAQLYWFVLGAAVLAFAGVWALTRSGLGRTWQACRAGNAAAASVGIRITRHKIVAFVLSAALAGWAGILLLTVQTTADQASFGPVQSLLLVTAAMLGGIENPLGMIVGGITLSLAPEVFQQIGLTGNWVAFLLGIAVVALIVWTRGGIRTPGDG